MGVAELEDEGVVEGAIDGEFVGVTETLGRGDGVIDTVRARVHSSKYQKRPNSLQFALR